MCSSDLLDAFLQAQIDAFEGNDPCRSNGVCDETCNTGGELGDPDCAASHCGADGICAEACVAPRDPDCAARDASNCGDNGVCDLGCPSDPDCARDCGADGNCIPGCSPPDPDCAGGASDAGTGSGGNGGGAGSGNGGARGSGGIQGDTSAGGCALFLASPRTAPAAAMGILVLLAGAVRASRRRRGARS